MIPHMTHMDEKDPYTHRIPTWKFACSTKQILLEDNVFENHNSIDLIMIYCFIRNDAITIYH